MRYLFQTIFFSVAASLFLVACNSDVTMPEADFDVTVSGEAPNATLTLVNNSQNGAKYTWSFSEGASVETTNDKSPTNITVDKAGELEIILVAENGEDVSSKTKTITISGNSAIQTFNDITFGWSSDAEVYGRAFSTETGKMYKDSEINAENGALIDLLFLSMQGYVNYFENPADPSQDQVTIPNAATTKVENYVSQERFDAATFAEITHAGFLKDLTITNTNDSFGPNYEDGVVLFENTKGQKGIIKIKEQTGYKLVVDIKVEKY